MAPYAHWNRLSTTLMCSQQPDVNLWNFPLTEPISTANFRASAQRRDRVIAGSPRQGQRQRRRFYYCLAVTHLYGTHKGDPSFRLCKRDQDEDQACQNSPAPENTGFTPSGQDSWEEENGLNQRDGTPMLLVNEPSQAFKGPFGYPPETPEKEAAGNNFNPFLLTCLFDFPPETP